MDEEPQGIDHQARDRRDPDYGDGDGESVFLFAGALPRLGQFPEAARRGDAVAGNAHPHAPAGLVHITRVAGARFPYQ
jgi:hypothetical protein